jgi:hypothetical protein
MRTPAEYRAEAEIYIRRAERAETDARGQRFLQMAQACLRLADLAELVCSPPPQVNREASSPMYTGL